ncbi:MAG TPA: hypothetical protein PL009_10780 [Flavipsychrobacter sp.]|nr:hypothetical protein [Flavipsychrobacter sp.]
MVEVFKTNVEGVNVANEIASLLLQHFPKSRISFDLEDCDKVLRIEGHSLCTATIMQIISACGFVCTILD